MTAVVTAVASLAPILGGAHSSLLCYLRTLADLQAPSPGRPFCFLGTHHPAIWAFRTGAAKPQGLPTTVPGHWSVAPFPRCVFPSIEWIVFSSDVELETQLAYLNSPLRGKRTG